MRLCSHTVFKSGHAVILFTLIVNSVACTALVNYQYFRPDAAGGQLSSSDLYLPKNAIIFRHSNYQVTIYTNPLRSETKAVSPTLMPPVIPVATTQKTYPQLVDLRILRVSVDIWLKEGRGQIDFQKMNLIEGSDNIALTPVRVEEWHSNLHKAIEVQPVQMLQASRLWPSARFDLYYELKNNNLASLRTFQLAIGDLKINGQKVSLPLITFKRANSNVIGTIP